MRRRLFPSPSWGGVRGEVVFTSQIRLLILIILYRKSVFIIIRIVSSDKFLGTLCFQFREIYMAPYTRICDLYNGYSYIGAMVGHSFTVYQKIRKVNAKFGAAFTLAKSFDMLISYCLYNQVLRLIHRLTLLREPRTSSPAS